MDIIVAFLIGAALGSFSLVLAWRLQQKRNWVSGRSKCDFCHKALEPKDLIPVISYLWIRGRCRYCHKKLPLTLFIAEVSMGTALALSYFFWPYSLDSLNSFILLALWGVMLTIMSSLVWYDIRWGLLPNKLVYPLIYLSSFFAIVRSLNSEQNFINSVLLAIAGATFLFFLLGLLFLISKGKWIGFGDVRLAIAIGLIVANPVNSWLVLFIASVIGLLFSLPQIILSKKSIKSKIPFGPFLLLSTITVFIFGDKIQSFYNFILGI